MLFGTKTILQKFPQPKDRRFDLGAQLLLGIWNALLPQVLPNFFLGLKRRTDLVKQMVDLGPTVVVAVWVLFAFLMRTWLRKLADNAVSAGWQSQVFFPWLFVEDFIPVLLFADSEALSTQFLVTVVCVMLWEMVRDSPALKAYLLSLIVCPRGLPTAETCPRLNRMRGVIAGVVVFVLAVFGGGAGALPTADVVEQAGAELGIAEAHKHKMIVSIDVARHNMMGELIAVVLMLVSVMVTHAADRPPVFAWQNVTICFVLEVVKVFVCTMVNAKSLIVIGKELPRMDNSRFVVCHMAIIMANTVSLVVFHTYVDGVRANLQGQCGL
jgi:hypothetical protein